MRMFILFVILFFMVLNPAFAVEVAPRISDRIRSLKSLMLVEAGIKANEKAIEVNRLAIK